ncbi:unnamed protein product [Notodromas monacha]|uniref:Secreted protein n=1 Tax=Notodromas monacha TaxID=399045 RepID=A0A7R9GF86_9CRUS|nr:unnamed protein product [Notodromas monacha]CAG0920532.1 unnamed protein product [Notodromas monacha]
MMKHALVFLAVSMAFTIAKNVVDVNALPTTSTDFPSTGSANIETSSVNETDGTPTEKKNGANSGICASECTQHLHCEGECDFCLMQPKRGERPRLMTKLHKPTGEKYLHFVGTCVKIVTNSTKPQNRIF